MVQFGKENILRLCLIIRDNSYFSLVDELQANRAMHVRAIRQLLILIYVFLTESLGQSSPSNKFQSIRVRYNIELFPDRRDGGP